MANFVLFCFYSSFFIGSWGMGIQGYALSVFIYQSLGLGACLYFYSF